MSSNLATEQCQALEKGTPPLDKDGITELQKQAPQWSVADDSQSIEREFKFKNFFETVEFVNAVAWIANQQDHHPDLNVSYNRCHVTWSTHSVGGLSRNDFICAARVDTLLN